MADVRLLMIAKDFRLNGLRDAIDSGDGAGSVAFYAGNVLLGRCLLSKPCAPDASAGVLTFGPIYEHAAALAKGRANRAVIATGSGAPVLECDVSGQDGDGLIKINDPNIAAGGPIRVSSLAFIER